MDLPGTTKQITTITQPEKSVKLKEDSGNNAVFAESPAKNAEVFISLLTRQIGAEPVKFIANTLI